MKLIKPELKYTLEDLTIEEISVIYALLSRAVHTDLCKIAGEELYNTISNANLPLLNIMIEITENENIGLKLRG